MIFSEDNYGRFEAMVLVLTWLAFGSAVMILIIDGAHLIGPGISSSRYVIRPVVVVGGVVWLRPLALSRFREVSEIVRDDHSRIPTQLMIAVVILSVVMGAMAIVAHQFYLLARIKTLGLPWAAITAPVMSMLVSIAAVYAGAVAWFALFPAAADPIS